MEISPSALVTPARRRGLVLGALHVQYPNPSTESALDVMLGGLYSGAAREYVTDISYLEEIGALTRMKVRVQGAVIHSYRLTAKGLRLVERAETDSAVEV